MFDVSLPSMSEAKEMNEYDISPEGKKTIRATYRLRQFLGIQSNGDPLSLNNFFSTLLLCLKEI